MTASGEVRVRLSVDGKLLDRRGQGERIRKMLADGKVRRLRVSFVPEIVGGAATPTLTGKPLESLLQKSVRLRLERVVAKGKLCEAVYSVRRAANFLPPGAGKK
jgi:riboflavin biosynthesis pyrimidine reductase